MKEKVYDDIQSVLGKLPFPEYVFSKKDKCIAFAGNTFAGSVEKIFNSYTFQRSKGLSNPHYCSWEPRNYTRLLSDFSEKEKTIMFIVIYSKLINDENPPANLDKNFVKLIRAIFKIADCKFKSIQLYFKNTLPYQDKEDCIYFSGAMENKLMMAKGLHMIFSLKDQNEVVYVKYIEQVDLFLIRSFHRKRVYNSINSEIVITGHKLYSGERIEIGGEVLGHSEMLQLMQNNVLYKTIKIAQKEFCPEILLSAEEDMIVISGRSAPLSPQNYLEPILDWLEMFKEYGGKKLEVQLNLEYYNTYTYKFLLRLLNACHTLEKSGKKVRLTWYYSSDDDEMIESGKQMKHFYNGNFRCVPINDGIISLV